MEFSAKQIATFIQGEIVGDENATVHTFAKIEEGIPGAISFYQPQIYPYIYETQSSIVLVNKDFVPEQEVKATLIKVDNAYESLAKLLNLYEQSKPKRVELTLWPLLPRQLKLARMFTLRLLPALANTQRWETIRSFIRTSRLAAVPKWAMTVLFTLTPPSTTIAGWKPLHPALRLRYRCRRFRLTSEGYEKYRK